MTEVTRRDLLRWGGAGILALNAIVDNRGRTQH